MRARGIVICFFGFHVLMGWIGSGMSADLRIDAPRHVQTGESQHFRSAAIETLAFCDFDDGFPEGWETVDLTCEPHWHRTTSGAFEGYSYFCGIESPVGRGYLDLWEEYLETPEIVIPEGTTSLMLSFIHKVDTESPEDPVWDGSAVFLSENDGPFHVIFPQGRYTTDSLRAFAYRGQMGIPGWTGLGDAWFHETFHLGEFAESSTIKVRYTFVSDVMVNSFDDVYAGVWVDEIIVVDDGDTLFFDDGGDTAPGQMGFSTPCYGDFWSLTNDNSALDQQYGRYDYPPEGWTPGQFSMVCDDQPLINAALVSPAYALPACGYPMTSFYSLVEVPDFDGDGDYILEDYFDMEISSAESNFLVWHNLISGHGASGNDSTWEVYHWDHAAALKLHEYCGQHIKLRWRLHTDADDDGGGGCDWMPCNGRGLFVDDVLLVHVPYPNIDVRFTRIVVPFPNTVGVTTPVAFEMANYGSSPFEVHFLYCVLLDGEFKTVGDPPYWVLEPPYPTVAADGTTRVTFDWTPTDSGDFYIRAFLIVCLDDFNCADVMTTPVPVHVWGGDKATVGYFDRFSPDTSYIDPVPDSGPLIRFTIDRSYWYGDNFLSTILIRGASLNGPVDIYICGDSLLTMPFIESFQHMIDGPRNNVEIDLSMSPEAENLIFDREQFWIHVRASDLTEGQFIARGAPLDSARNWWYTNGEAQLSSEAWEILALLEQQIPSYPHMHGDANRDGVVNVLDVIAVANHILGIHILEGDALCQADCTQDGIINIMDAVFIVWCILDLEDCFW